jgi:serine phosphatase RsbU (regulator of sigma subunit)
LTGFKKIIAVLFIAFSGIYCFSQNNATDSLLRLANSTSSDTVKVVYYYQIFSLNRNSNPLVARTYILECNEILKLHLNTHRLRYFQTLIDCSTTDRALGLYSEALPYINSAFKLADSLNNSALTAMAYGEKGLLHMNLGDYQKALECFLKDVSILKITSSSDSSIYGVYNNIGIIYAQTGQLKKAEEYFRNCLEIGLKKNRKSYLGNGYNNVGVIKIMQGNMDSVLYYLSKGKQVRQETNDLANLSGSYNNFSLYYKINKKYKLALAYADSSYTIASRVKAKHELLEVLDTYSKIYEELKDYKNAFDYYRQKQTILQEIQTDKLDRKISEYQGNMEVQKKQQELNETSNQLLLKEAEGVQQNLKLNLLLLGVLSLVAAMFIVSNKNKKIRKAHLIIENQKNEVELQKNIIQEKHKDITDSINYAQKIQTALIVSDQVLREKIGNLFVLFKPRDVVSGDFYWFAEKDGKKLLAVADCTGHGVPGAFMSMIGITLLNQVVNEKGITSPAEILNHLREGVINSLNQTGNESGKRDGMDVALITWDGYSLVYAGANNPGLVLREKAFIDLKPNKQPVGLYERQEPFTEQSIELKKNDIVYLFTDGITDQFGGVDGKKVKMKRWKEWLLEITGKPMEEQKIILENKLDEWKKNIAQTDDILVIGMKC